MKGKITDLNTEDIIKNMTEKSGGTFPPSTPSPQGVEFPPAIGETYHHSLDDAATLLINILTPAVRDYLFEMADVTLKIPRWQLLLGSALAQYESGNTASPSIDPSWRNIELAMGDSTCSLPSCGKKFIPKRYGQLYCSQGCGDEARRAEMLERHAERDKYESAKKKFMRENPTQAALMGMIE